MRSGRTLGLTHTHSHTHTHVCPSRLSPPVCLLRQTTFRAVHPHWLPSRTHTPETPRKRRWFPHISCFHTHWKCFSFSFQFYFLKIVFFEVKDNACLYIINKVGWNRTVSCFFSPLSYCNHWSTEPLKSDHWIMSIEEFGVKLYSIVLSYSRAFTLNTDWSHFPHSLHIVPFESSNTKTQFRNLSPRLLLSLKPADLSVRSPTPLFFTLTLVRGWIRRFPGPARVLQFSKLPHVWFPLYSPPFFSLFQLIYLSHCPFERKGGGGGEGSQMQMTHGKIWKIDSGSIWIQGRASVSISRVVSLNQRNCRFFHCLFTNHEPENETCSPWTTLLYKYK